MNRRFATSALAALTIAVTGALPLAASAAEPTKKERAERAVYRHCAEFIGGDFVYTLICLYGLEDIAAFILNRGR